jgi:spore germination cell wall hydrolase CwlJ-like protein
MNLIQPIKILIALTLVLSFNQITNVPELTNNMQETKVAKVVDPKQLTCMAKNIFYEAGSESLNGQAAVARVVMNRIAHGFGKDPCAVIYQASHVDKLIDDEMQKVKL